MKSKQHRVRLKVELKSPWAGKTFSYRNIPLSTSAPLNSKGRTEHTGQGVLERPSRLCDVPARNDASNELATVLQPSRSLTKNNMAPRKFHES